MRLLLAEDETSLSRAIVTILKKIITQLMQHLMVWKH